MLTAAVIVISLIVQGLTLEPLVKFTGVAGEKGTEHEETVARLRLAEAALARLDELADGPDAPDDAIDRARSALQTRLGHAQARAAGTGRPHRAATRTRPRLGRERGADPALRRRGDQRRHPPATAAFSGPRGN